MKSIFFMIFFLMIYWIYTYFHPECRIQSLSLILNTLAIYIILMEFSSKENVLQVFAAEIYAWFLALQDEKTLHIGKSWILYSFILLIVLFPDPVNEKNVLGALLFSLPGIVMCKWKGWLGSADSWFLSLFGFLLGSERMIVCMLICCLLGCIYAFLFKKEKLPFLSFLAAGFIASFLRGYLLYAKIFL